MTGRRWRFFIISTDEKMHIYELNMHLWGEGMRGDTVKNERRRENKKIFRKRKIQMFAVERQHEKNVYFK